MSYQLIMKGPYTLFNEATEDTHIAVVLSDVAPLYLPYSGYASTQRLVSKKFGDIDLSPDILWIGVPREMFVVKTEDELIRDIQGKVRILGDVKDLLGREEQG